MRLCSSWALPDCSDDCLSQGGDRLTQHSLCSHLCLKPRSDTSTSTARVVFAQCLESRRVFSWRDECWPCPQSLASCTTCPITRTEVTAPAGLHVIFFFRDTEQIRPQLMHRCLDDSKPCVSQLGIFRDCGPSHFCVVFDIYWVSWVPSTGRITRQIIPTRGRVSLLANENYEVHF